MNVRQAVVLCATLFLGVFLGRVSIPKERVQIPSTVINPDKGIRIFTSDSKFVMLLTPYNQRTDMLSTYSNGAESDKVVWFITMTINDQNVTLSCRNDEFVTR